ncbi:RNA polymerase sigma factor SigZ [Halalkalibacter urbisdiaboli]|uniref:RNA polymerase sigma factor SigZ n=1 Tax=Halalkalibacter urbisdiaboli TaxID=1960589 RepID=UPI000B43F33C|nr:RNA polymerase sigma factor SigZ [Halalkalibacter urbisdiaboli]
MFEIKQINIEQIWEELSFSVMRFIRERVSNEQDAEDILQKVFIKIYNHLSDLSEQKNLNSWIYQITKNTIIDHYRSQAKNQTMLHYGDNKEILHPETNINNENEVVTTWLKELIEQLPKKYKDALIYVELEQHTQKELATKLGLSLSGAKSRVQRGREKLRNILFECCHIEFDNYGNILDYDVNKGNCSCREIKEIQ